MEARAQYAFNATQEDELSFRQGEVLKVKSMEDEHWYMAEKGGKKGFIPASYIQMEPHDWYKGKMSRTEAEAYLMRKESSGHGYPDGCFVIRDCESDKNQFSLSVKHGRGAQHFKILSNGDGEYYLWPNKTFPSINKLIDHHRTVSIAREPRVTILLKDMASSSSVVYFEAQYDFTPDTPDELSFRRGHRIQLLEKCDKDWWNGLDIDTNERGLFPRTYVKELK